MDLRTATKMVAAGIQVCLANNYQMNLAVVDDGGHLVGFARMDGAWKGSVDIAIRKAKTAQLFRLPTGALGTLSHPDRRTESLYGIEHSNGGLITFPGGRPTPCGAAVGVSGGSVAQDDEVASAMLAALAD